MNPLSISVVIPVYNEKENLPHLFGRLTASLECLNRSSEIIFVDDGSRDGSFALLKQFVEQSKIPSRLVRLNRNYGQHAAIFAGFAQVQGDIVVTLDADLQNPPEEIVKLLQKIDEGYEVAGGYRENRQDSFLRKIPSFFVAKLASRFVGVELKDYGCMLRAYRRELVELMKDSGGVSTYIPALAASFAGRVAEVPVRHEARRLGKSKYSLLRLLRLNFDLMTSFSLLPIQMIGVVGFFISALGLAFSGFLIFMRLILGADWAVQGVFTLFGILFFFVGLQMLALGLMGEYIGRIYQEVRRRPRFRVQQVLTSPSSLPH